MVAYEAGCATVAPSVLTPTSTTLQLQAELTALLGQANSLQQQLNAMSSLSS